MTKQSDKLKDAAEKAARGAAKAAARDVVENDGRGIARVLRAIGRLLGLVRK